MSSTLRTTVLLFACLILLRQPSNAGSLSLSDYNHHGVTGWFDGTLATEHGGRITATFNSNPLSNVYCVEAFNNIGLSTYDSTLAFDGIIHGHLVPNGGQIAWLILNIAPTVGADLDKQNGLQGVLWNLSAPSGHSFSMSPSAHPAAYGYYSNYLAASLGQSAPLSGISWISPSHQDLSPAQGLVASHLPEPSTSVMGVAGLAYGGWQMFRRRRQHGSGADVSSPAWCAPQLVWNVRDDAAVVGERLSEYRDSMDAGSIAESEYSERGTHFSGANSVHSSGATSAPSPAANLVGVRGHVRQESA